jgi:hypothetical protein
MLIVPELNAVFLFVPRTGSDTLCLELMRKFPNAFLPYRHMEADGVPAGYENWRKVGFVRHPLARLWSLFKYCSIIADGGVVKVLEDEVKRVAASVVGKSFEDWVLYNEELYLPVCDIPVLHQLHHVPETRKSQFATLRPDLGTVVLKYQDLAKHMTAWGLDPSQRNGATPCPKVPYMDKKLKRHMTRYFKWDMEQKCDVL